MVDWKKQGGDDLDDFDLQPVRSDDEIDDNDQAGLAIHPSRRKAPDDEEAPKDNKKNKKRKVSGQNGSDKPKHSAAVDAETQKSKAEKRRKQRESRKHKLQDKDAEEDGLITGDAAEQCAIVWRHFMAHRGNELSELELEPIKIEDEDFVAAPAQFLHTPRDLPHIRPFLKALVPDWATAFSKKGSGSARAGKVPGSPSVVIVTAAAITAANIFKELKEFNSLCRVGKLFAKHVKVEEQEHFLNNEISRIVVGTPNRIAKLIDTGALKMDQVRLVVVDARRDGKGMNVFHLKPLCADLLALCQAHIFPLMHTKKLRMALF